MLISGFCGDSFQPMAQLCLDRLRSYGLEIPEQIGWQRMTEAQQLQEIFTQAGLDDMHIERRSIGYHIDLEGWWEVVWNAGFRKQFHTTQNLNGRFWLIPGNTRWHTRVIWSDDRLRMRKFIVAD